MPFMDGLTFIQKLRKKITGTKVVIFSGYDEFEYAKEAIKLEAQEYILKPIHAEELKELFIRLRKTIEEERDQKRNVERLERYYVESEPFLKEQFFTALLEGRLREEEIKYYLNMYQMNMNASYHAVGIVKGEKA